MSFAEGKNRPKVALMEGTIGARWAAVVGVGMLVFLSGCSLSVPPATNDVVSSSSSRSLCTLSAEERIGLVEEAWSSAPVQALAARLEQQGWRQAAGAEQVGQGTKGYVVLLPFEKPSSPATPLPPPPKPSEKPQLEPASTRYPSEKPSPSESGAFGAYIVYTAYSNGGEEAFVVINTLDQGHVLHLYPDEERHWLLFFDDVEVYSQLRQNERFRRFESWLKSSLGGTVDVRAVSFGPVLVEEKNNTAFIFVTGLGSTLSTSARQNCPPTVYLPLDHVVATYLLLARVTARQGNQLVLDPQGIWLLPRASLNFLPSGEPVAHSLKFVRVGSGENYTVIAGGTKPADWPGLRSFAWFSPLPDTDAQLMGSTKKLVSLEATNGFSARWALTSFIWELEDFSDTNVLLLFETDAEPVLEASNKLAPQAEYGVIAVNNHSQAPIYLGGFSHLAVDEVENHCEKALQALAGSESPYLEIPLETVARLLEHRLGLTMTQLGIFSFSWPRQTRKAVSPKPTRN